MSIEFHAAVIGTFGLAMDVLGVIVLALFTDVFSRYILRTRSQIGPDEDYSARNRMAQSSRWSTYVGLALIVGGFIVQGIALWMPII